MRCCLEAWLLKLLITAEVFLSTCGGGLGQRSQGALQPACFPLTPLAASVLGQAALDDQLTRHRDCPPGAAVTGLWTREKAWAPTARAEGRFEPRLGSMWRDRDSEGESMASYFPWQHRWYQEAAPKQHPVGKTRPLCEFGVRRRHPPLGLLGHRKQWSIMGKCVSSRLDAWSQTELEPVHVGQGPWPFCGAT